MNYKFYQFFLEISFIYKIFNHKIRFSGKCIKTDAISKFMFVDPDNKIGYFCTECST